MNRHSGNFDNNRWNRGRGNSRQFSGRGFPSQRSNRGYVPQANRGHVSQSYRGQTPQNYRGNFPRGNQGYVHQSNYSGNHGDENQQSYSVNKESEYFSGDNIQHFSPLRVTVEGEQRLLQGSGHSHGDGNVAQALFSSEAENVPYDLHHGYSDSLERRRDASYSENIDYGEKRLSVSPVSSKSETSPTKLRRGSLSPVSSKHSLSPVSSNASMSPVSDDHDKSFDASRYTTRDYHDKGFDASRYTTRDDHDKGFDASRYTTRDDHDKGFDASRYTTRDDHDKGFDASRYSTQKTNSANTTRKFESRNRSPAPESPLGKRHYTAVDDRYGTGDGGLSSGYKQRKTEDRTRDHYNDIPGNDYRKSGYHGDYWKVGGAFDDRRGYVSESREYNRDHINERYRTDRKSRSPVMDYRSSGNRISHSDDVDPYTRHSRRSKSPPYRRGHSRSKSPPYRQRHSRSKSPYRQRRSRSISPSYRHSDSSSQKYRGRKHSRHSRSRSRSRKRSESPAYNRSRRSPYRRSISSSSRRRSRSLSRRRSSSPHVRRSGSPTHRHDRKHSRSPAQKASPEGDQSEVDLLKLTESASESISKTLMFADNAKPEELLSVLLLQNELIRKQQQILEKKEEEIGAETKGQRSISPVQHGSQHSEQKHRSVSPFDKRRDYSRSRSNDSRRSKSTSPYRSSRRHSGGHHRSASPYNRHERRSISPRPRRDYRYRDDRKSISPVPHKFVRERSVSPYRRKHSSYSADKDKIVPRDSRGSYYSEKTSSYSANKSKGSDVGTHPPSGASRYPPPVSVQGIRSGAPRPPNLPYTSSNPAFSNLYSMPPPTASRGPPINYNQPPFRHPPPNLNQPPPQVQPFRYGPPVFPAGAPPSLPPPPFQGLAPGGRMPFMYNPYTSSGQPRPGVNFQQLPPSNVQPPTSLSNVSPQQQSSPETVTSAREQTSKQKPVYKSNIIQVQTTPSVGNSKGAGVSGITTKNRAAAPSVGNPKGAGVARTSSKYHAGDFTGTRKDVRKMKSAIRQVNEQAVNIDEMPEGLLESKPAVKVSTASGESSILPTFIGSKAKLKWKINEIPPSTSVQVKNGRGEVLFDVKGNHAVIRQDFRERLEFMGDVGKGRIEFLLSNCSYADEGIYVASYQNKKVTGPKLVLWLEVKDRDEVVMLWQMDSVSKFQPVNVLRRNGLILFTALGQNATISDDYKNRVKFTGDTTKGLIVFSLSDCSHGDEGGYTSSYNDIECEGRHLVIKYPSDKKESNITGDAESRLAQQKEREVMKERRSKLKELKEGMNSTWKSLPPNKSLQAACRKIKIKLETRISTDKPVKESKQTEFTGFLEIVVSGKHILLAKAAAKTRQPTANQLYAGALATIKAKSVDELLNQKPEGEEETVVDPETTFTYENSSALLSNIVSTRVEMKSVLTTIIQDTKLNDEDFAHALDLLYKKYAIDLLTLVNCVRDHEEHKVLTEYSVDPNSFLRLPDVKSNREDLLKLNILIPENQSLDKFVILDSGDQKQRIYAAFNWLSKSAEKCGMLLQWYSRPVYVERAMKYLPRLIRKCSIWVQGNLISEACFVGGKYGMQLAAATALARLYETRPVIQKVAAKVVRDSNRVTYSKVRNIVESSKKDLGQGEEAIAKACEDILIRYKNEDTLETLEIHPGFPNSVYVEIRKVCAANQLAVKASSCVGNKQSDKSAPSSDKTSILTINKLLSPYEIMNILLNNNGCSGGYRLMSGEESQQIADSIFKHTLNCVELKEGQNIS